MVPLTLWGYIQASGPIRIKQILRNVPLLHRGFDHRQYNGFVVLLSLHFLVISYEPIIQSEY